MVTNKEFNPHSFSNPASTLIYPLAAYYLYLELGYGKRFIDPHLTQAQMFFRNMDVLLKWPRLFTVFFVIASLPLLYLCGRHWVGKTASFLGLTFYALSSLVIYFGQILRPDLIANFCIVLLMFLLSFLPEHRRRRQLAVALGVVAGLGISTRFFCLGMLAPIVTAYGVLALRAQTFAEKKEMVINAIVSLFAWIVTFFITSPFVFLDFSHVVEDLKFEAQADFGGVTGLSPLGNLSYYLFEAAPLAVGWYVTVAFLFGLVLRAWPFPKQPVNLQTVSYYVLLAIFFLGFCVNPRHWGRWILPMLPIICLVAGFALARSAHVLENLIKLRLSARFATAITFFILIGASVAGYFEPFRHMVDDQWQKGHLSARALAFPYIKEHIKPDTKIALDTGWDWPEMENWIVEENIWRPDFVPPRPHSYYFPEDLGKAGFKYIVVQTWNRMFYQSEDQKAAYPREYAFYVKLRKYAPLIFSTYTKDEKNHPILLGQKVGDRVSPIEIYDLTGMAEGKVPDKEQHPPED